MKKIILLIMAVLFILAGCSTKPSADQIKELLFDKVDYKIFDVQHFTKVNGFWKNNNTYVADVNYDIIFKVGLDDIKPEGGIGAAIFLVLLERQYGRFKKGDTRKRSQEITLIKKEKGWAIAE